MSSRFCQGEFVKDIFNQWDILSGELPEHLFHLPELLIFESKHIGRELRIGAENLFAVISGRLLDLRLIDDDIIPVRLQVFTAALVTNEGFGTILELLLQGPDDHHAILFILLVCLIFGGVLFPAPIF
jgi:hypothetical protein